MKGDIVRAANLLGAWLVVASLILVLGILTAVGLSRSQPMPSAEAGVLFNVYSSDPAVRMNKLLDQSEDLRQIEDEWRNFWFQDQPSHLTIERVHGGIQ